MIKHLLKFFLQSILFLQIIQSSILVAYADDLGDFESAVSKNTKYLSNSKKSSQYLRGANNYHHSTGNDFAGAFFGEVFGDLFATILFLGVMQGGMASAERVNPDSTSIDVIPRDAGDPLIPFARIDSHYQWVENDIYAIDFRAEGGWGPFGLAIRKTKYNENLITGEKDELNFLQVEFLYRMSWSKYFEIDIGIGALDINGEEDNSGTSFSIPCLIYPVKNFGIEFRPTWTDINGNKVRDYDSCLVFRTDYISIKVGYRVLKVAEESLRGPYLGASFYY